MKKIFFLLIISHICFSIMAGETDEKFALTTVTNKFGYTSIELFDNYLSPLYYNGSALKYENEKRKFFSPDNLNLSNAQHFELTFGTARNPAKTSSVTYFSGSYSWGMHYHFRPVRRLQILAGGSADVVFAAKLSSRNVNNPYNMDLATNINMSAVAIYDILPEKDILRVQAAFEIPTIGCMFAPEMGASYYEMFYLKSDADLVHFSSFHNKEGFRQTYTVFVTLRKMILNASLSGNHLKYKANNMIFKTNEFVVSLGWTYHFRSFAGKRNKAPENFIKY